VVFAGNFTRFRLTLSATDGRHVTGFGGFGRPRRSHLLQHAGRLLQHHAAIIRVFLILALLQPRHQRSLALATRGACSPEISRTRKKGHSPAETTEPRRKNWPRIHELHETRRAVRATFASHRAQPEHTPSVIEENAWEFVKFRGKSLSPASVLSQPSFRAESMQWRVHSKKRLLMRHYPRSAKSSIRIVITSRRCGFREPGNQP